MAEPPLLSSRSRNPPAYPVWFIAIVVVGTIAATAITLLALTAANPILYAKLVLIRNKFWPEFAGDSPYYFLALLYVSGLAAFSVIGGVAIAPLLLTFGKITRRKTAVAWALIAGLFFYLAHDEPLRTSDFLPIKPVNATPEQKLAHEHLMLYGNHHPAGKDFADPIELTFPATNDRPTYVAWLKRERATIDQGWDELADLRAWWEELDQFEMIPDFYAGEPYGEIIAFKPIRAYSRFGGARAHLLALDGRGDEAVELLLPALRVGLRLQANPHTSVRAMVGLVTEKTALDQLAFIIDTCGVSEPLRQELRAILLSDPGPQGVQRLIVAERFNQAWMFLNIATPIDVLRNQGQSRELILFYVPLAFATSLVYNPHRTMNAQSRWTDDMIQAASRRDLKRVEQLEQSALRPVLRFSFKNGYGEAIRPAMNAQLAKEIEVFWKKEDGRIALLKKLETAPSESALSH